jgi:hypothetical protein
LPISKNSLEKKGIHFFFLCLKTNPLFFELIFKKF